MSVMRTLSVYDVRGDAVDVSSFSDAESRYVRGKTMVVLRSDVGAEIEVRFTTTELDWEIGQLVNVTLERP